MTDDTVTSVDNGDELANFEAEFYSTANIVKDEPAKEEAEDVDDLGEEESDPPATSDSEADEVDEADEDEPAPKKKNSARERIEQLNAKVREAERREAEYIRRMEQLEAAIREKANEERVPLREQLPATAPNPDATLEDGSAVYPLGEFDPKYVADLTQHTIDERMKALDVQRAQEEEARFIQHQREELSNQWTERLDGFEQEVPEVRENIRVLVDSFSSLDPGYGEYLAATLMSSEFGPQVMNYLSQNIGEAQRIVSSGPAAATLALGRLEARFAKDEGEGARKEKKMSKAPPPPGDRTRGTGGKFAVRPDTDNLDAFEKEFFS
jgi:hypothetical protein